MSNWDYQREENVRLQPGDYRLEITNAEERVSSSGNPMIVVTVKPNGSNITINHYITKGPYFNRNMTSFFDSFNISDGDFNFMTWVGAVGAARLKEDENGYLKVNYFINKSRADKLPEWVGEAPVRQSVTDIMSQFEDIDENGDDDIPFN